MVTSRHFYISPNVYMVISHILYMYNDILYMINCSVKQSLIFAHIYSFYESLLFQGDNRNMICLIN